MRLPDARATAVALAAAAVLRLSAAPPADPAGLLRAVGARVADYYQRAQHVMCTEIATVQPIDRDWSPQGLGRTVESDLRVEADGAVGDRLPEPRVVRGIRRINGRSPRPSDSTSRNGCTDPNPLSPEPLAFLLPQHREDYRFTSVRDGRERGRAALVMDFVSTDRTSRPELIQDEHGHDDCFDWTGPVALRGRVWVDAETFDVLRVDRSLAGPTDVRVSSGLQRRFNFAPFVTLDRDDVSMRFRPVTFTDPDEVLVLPESIDATTVVRNGLQSTRRTDTFRDYRRFYTAARIKDR